MNVAANGSKVNAAPTLPGGERGDGGGAPILIISYAQMQGSKQAMLKCMGASKLCSNVWEQARSPTRFVGERKDARSLRSTRCFLRVQEDTFSRR